MHRPIHWPIQPKQPKAKVHLSFNDIAKQPAADSVRLFIMSDSPPEKDVQWSDEGMESSYKFLQKLWGMHNVFLEKIKEKNNEKGNEEISRFTNNLIAKVSHNLENFRYNVIIANFYEMYNFINKELKKPINSSILIENYTKILILLSPFIPHFASECLDELKEFKNIKSDIWPKPEEKYLKKENVTIVVQINGKKRVVLEVQMDCKENKILEIINQNSKIIDYIKDKKIIKTIFVPNKIINLIIK